MSAPLAAGAVCGRPGCGHGEDLHDGICFGTACECVRFVEPAGALPMPVLPEPLSPERDRLRAAFVEALDNAHHTHPCPEYGKPYWTGCVHYDETGRVSGVGSCHNERRADAVLVVRDAEVESLRARVAELEAERHSTNEALDDAVQALRVNAVPSLSFAERAAAESDPGRRAAWRMLAEPNGEFDAYLRHPYRVGHDMPETGGVSTAEAAAVCRCDEPDADPYSCEADDCTAEFSELNPFGGGGPVEGHDAKVSRVCGCGWRTSVWHVNDGSAEAELHGHVVRVHGGTYPQRAGEGS